jgi:hypothetical protein
LDWRRIEKKKKRHVMAWAEVKAFGLKWELGSRFFFLSEFKSSFELKKSKDLNIFKLEFELNRTRKI